MRVIVQIWDAENQEATRRVGVTSPRIASKVAETLHDGKAAKIVPKADIKARAVTFIRSPARLCRDRSMRGERRGFLLDRGVLEHGRCCCHGLVPLNRFWLARHRASEHLVHARDRNDLE